MAGGKDNTFFVTISEGSVRKTLERMLYAPGANQIDVSPLEYFAVVDAILQDPTTPAMEDGRLFAVEQFLIDLITEEYLGLRSAAKLPPLPAELSNADVLVDLQRVAQLGRNELKAWAILYYRFVQIGLSLELEEIWTALAVNDSTYRRYYRHAIKRLTAAVRQREQAARRLNKARHLLARLPGEPEWVMIGRQGWMDDMLALVKNVPHTVMVSGGIGVGKRSLVRAVVAKLIHRELIDQVLWLDHPASVERVRLHLLELTSPDKPDAQRLDMRTYLLHYRTVIVLAGIDRLLANRDELNALLLDLDAATVFLIDHKYTPMSALTAHVPVPSLEPETAKTLAQMWWSRFQPGDTLTGAELDMLVQQSGACPGMLRRMIVEYGRALPHTVMQITLEDAYGDTLAMLSTFGRHALHSMALMSPAGSAPAQVSALFGSDTMVGMDELLRHHLLERLPSTDTYRLAAHVRMWILQDYQRGGSASSFIQDSLAMIDVAVSNGKVEAQNTIEYLLSDGEFELAAARRQMWLREGWQRGVQANLWALWLDLLRGATEAAFSTDAMLWLGRGICARWLGLWHESAASLEEAIELSGDTGDFILQAQAIIELSVLKRLLAQYEDIDRDHARVLQAAELFGLYPLVERVQLERVQIAVELGNGGAALQYLRGVPENTRTHLLRAEAHFLVGDLQRSLNESQAAIAAISGDMAALGKANVLLGRVYSAQQDFLTARRHLELAVTLLEQVNDPYGLGRALGNLGALLTDMKLRVLATQTLERAEALQRRLGDRVALFTTQHNLRLLRVDMIQHG